MRDGVFRARFALGIAALTVALAIALVWLVATRGAAPGEDTSAVARAGIASPRGAEAPEAPLAPPGEPEDVPEGAGAGSEAPPAAPAAPARDPTIWTRGRVVDQRTGEGVGWCEVVLGAGELEVRGLTAENGGFELGDPGFERAPLARVVDPPGPEGTTLGSFAWSKETHDAGGWVLAVSIGPTYFLGGRWLPVGPLEVEARLIELPPEDPNENLLLVSPTGLEQPARNRDLEPRDWPWIPVRIGARPFARYARQYFEPSSDHEAFLSVRSRLHGLRGRGPVESTVGIHRQLVDVPTEIYERSGGQVVTAKGAAIAGADVIVTDARQLPDEHTARPPRWQHARTDANGTFEVEGSQGETHVWMCAGGFEIEPVQISGGRYRLRGGGTKDQASRVSCATRSSAAIVLAELGSGSSLFFGRRAVIDADTGALSFGILPVERHQVRVVAIGADSRMLPVAGVDVAAAPIHGRLDPSGADEPRLPFRCEARDKKSATILDHVAVVFGPQGCLLDAIRPGDAPPFLPTALPPADWLAWAEDYAPVRGSRRDLRVRDQELVVEVELGKGWGASLYVRTCDPTEPRPDPRAVEAMEAWHGATALAGAFAFPAPGPAEIHAPGVGRLDAVDGRGDAFVTLPFLPSTLEVVCEGWRIRRIERFPRGDAPPVFPFEYVVWMERKRVY